MKNQPEYEIRDANNADISEIKKVVLGVLREFGLKGDEAGKDADLNDIEASYFQKNGYFGVVTDQSAGTIVGTFGLFQISSEVCELRKMYLLESARGKGYGKVMLDYAINEANQRHYRKIRLETISVLQRAIRLYKSYGFTETSPREKNDRVDQAFELVISAALRSKSGQD